MKNFFIVNPIAGKGKALNLVEEALKKIDQNYYKNNDFQIIKTNFQGEGTQICNKLAKKFANEVINIFACGGDGTCFEVLNGIVGFENVNFGMIPVGSCNDFLKSFPDFDFMNIEKQIEGKTKKIDIIKINDEYVLNVANFGFDARANDDQLKLRKKFKSVKKAYNYALFKNIISPKLGDKAIVKVDDLIVFDGKILLAAVANAQFYGGGFKCAPYAQVDDGLIDIIIVKKVSILTFARLVKYYKKGKHLDDSRFNKYVTFKQGRIVEIVAKNNLVSSFDGEVRNNQAYNMKIVDHKINFIIPNK